MEIIFAPKGILQINDARIVYPNFSGAPTKYNRAGGEKDFCVVIPDRGLTLDEMDNIAERFIEADIRNLEDTGETLFIDGNPVTTLAEALIAMNWNVTIKAPREEGDSPFMYLRVKVKYGISPALDPNVYMITGDNKVKLDKDNIDILDNIQRGVINLDIRPRDWNNNGDTGRTAYLIGMEVEQLVTDRFAD